MIMFVSVFRTENSCSKDEPSCKADFHLDSCLPPWHDHPRRIGMAVGWPSRQLPLCLLHARFACLHMQSGSDSKHTTFQQLPLTLHPPTSPLPNDTLWPPQPEPWGTSSVTIEGQWRWGTPGHLISARRRRKTPGHRFLHRDTGSWRGPLRRCM